MERNTVHQCKYDGDRKERGEVDKISFRFGTRVDCDAVEPTPPQPQMAVMIMDASPEEQCWAESS